MGFVLSFGMFLLAIFNYPPFLLPKDMVMQVSGVFLLLCTSALLCEYMGWTGLAGIVRNANIRYKASFSSKYCLERKLFVDFKRGLFLFKHKDKWFVFGLDQYRCAEADGNMLCVEFEDESIPVVTIETTKAYAKEWASRLRRFEGLGAK